MADLKISQLTGATTPLAGTEVVPVVQSNTTKKVSVANLTAGRSVGMQQANISAVAGGGFINPAFVAGDGTGSLRLLFMGAPYSGVPANKPWFHSYQDIYIGSDAGITVNIVSGGTSISFDAGNLKPTAAKGVNFTANTPAAGMTSQLLNWYEEGTWTGGVSFGGAATAITYSNTLGYYTRVGNLVTVSAYINLSNKGSATGAAKITVLPFTCANNAAAYSAPSLQFSNLTYSGQVSAYINIGNTTLDLVQTTEAGATSALTNTNFANNTAFVVSLSYRAA